MTETKDKEKNESVIISLKMTVEEMINQLASMELSGAVFFIGVNNKEERLSTALARIEIPAEPGMKDSASIMLYDSNYLMTHEETEMLSYKDAEIYLGHEGNDIVVRVRRDKDEAGGTENV